MYSISDFSQHMTPLMQDIVTATCFVLGAAISGMTGWVGMSLAVRGNVRCAAAAVHGLNPALRVAFDTGGWLTHTHDAISDEF